MGEHMPKAEQEASARPRRSVGLIKPNPLLRGAFPACIAIALLVLGSQGARATTVSMTFSAGNGQTWTCPPGVTNVAVECWGQGVLAAVLSRTPVAPGAVAAAGISK